MTSRRDLQPGGDDKIAASSGKRANHIAASISKSPLDVATVAANNATNCIHVMTSY